MALTLAETLTVLQAVLLVTEVWALAALEATVLKVALAAKAAKAGSVNPFPSQE